MNAYQIFRLKAQYLFGKFCIIIYKYIFTAKTKMIQSIAEIRSARGNYVITKIGNASAFYM